MARQSGIYSAVKKSYPLSWVKAKAKWKVLILDCGHASISTNTDVPSSSFCHLCTQAKEAQIRHTPKGMNSVEIAAYIERLVNERLEAITKPLEKPPTEPELGAPDRKNWDIPS